MSEIKFPPTEAVVISPEEMKKLNDEGIKIRKEIEKRSKKMFIPSSDRRLIR